MGTEPGATSGPDRTTAGPPLVSELDDYRRQFEEIKADAQELFRGVDEKQINWRQAPGRWSMAECFVHLNVTAGLYLPIIKSGMERGRERRLLGSGPFRHGFIGNWFVRSVEPPPKMKAKAPKQFVPPPDQPLDKITREFFACQEMFINYLYEANGLDLARIKLRSPATSLIRLSLGQAFALTAAHERRHLWQARQVRNDANFPWRSDPAA